MMKKVYLSLCALTLLAAPAMAQERTPPAKSTPGQGAELKTLKDKASYAIGLDIGRNLKRNAGELDPALVSKGIADALADAMPLLSDAQMRETILAFQKDAQTRQQEKLKVAGEKNKKDGAAFLAGNKGKPGVKTTATGLQYKVLTEGKGASPKTDDQVKVHYHGTLVDGTVFDSSVERGEPITFPVKGVIPGWTEALQKMKVGSKWRLFIPSELAYRDSAPPGSTIGPNSVLIFDVELLGIE
jgi:FKBP-type peptidyl-prolyl cis-trans isomerase FklB